MHQFRTHTCGELRKEKAGQTVKLSGWVDHIRDHGGIIFIDLRDFYGITQIVVHPERSFYKDVDQWRKETVLTFSGKVVSRTEETVNTKLDTGEIELEAAEMTVQGDCEILPFQVSREEQCPEATRLQYRFLDLRRKSMRDRILLRSKVIAEIRNLMQAQGFNEFQTPILTASSPEGARDYLVPSRVHPGHFYALPQAPQQFKQLLMVSGFDKYFQIAPCFRDEDARADRSPGEFYQLDLEMSFATQPDIFKVIEETLIPVFKKFSSNKIDDDFIQIPYKEAVEKYGCDKPDLRNPLQMIDVSDVFAGSDFKAFAGIAKKSSGSVKAIAVKGIASSQSKSFYESMITYAQSVGAKGLGYIIWQNGEAKSPIANYLCEERLEQLKQAGGIGDGDVMFFIADRTKKALEIGSHIIPELGKRLDLIEEGAFRFCWIVDYPMYEYDEQAQKIEFSHNPFSMPQGELKALETMDPLEILAWQYDLVCNGIELSSGAIRNHRPDIMYKAFGIAGYDKAEVDDKFSGMINAFKHGAPPHGGIAPGIDRIVMLLADVENIREIIAFPFNQQAQCLMMNAPAPINTQQLKELHLELNLPETEEV